MRNFLTITSAEYNEKLAESLRSRELEILAYDFEKRSHEDALASLANISWTPELEKYKGLSRDTMIMAAKNDGLDEETILLIANLQAKDRHLINLKAVEVESVKSERQYDSILVALPVGKGRDDAIAAVLQKEAAIIAKETGATII